MKSGKNFGTNRQNPEISTGLANQSQLGPIVLQGGMVSAEALINYADGREDINTFESLRRALVDELEPVGALQEELAETLGDIAWRIRHVELYKAGLVSQETRTLAQNRRNIQLCSPLPDVNLWYVKNLAQELDQARQIWAALEDLGSRDGGTPFCGWAITEAAYQFDLPLQELLAWKPAPGGAFDCPRFLEAALQRAITEAYRKRGVPEKEFWHRMKEAIQDRHDGVYMDLWHHRTALEDRLLSSGFPVGEDLKELHRYEEHLTDEFYEVLRQFQLLQAKRRKG